MRSNIDLSYYSQNYDDSKRRFLERAKTLSGPHEIGGWNVPSSIDNDLTVDHVYLPALEASRTLFVISSGIHGLEAYTGTGIQAMFMDEILPGIDRSQTGIFLVHCMNPFGFRHHRRGTEAHVNLNRNFSASADLYQMRNIEGRKLNERFLVNQPVDSKKSHLISQLRSVGGKLFIDDVSMDHLVKSVVCGQFETPRHLEFGGYGPEPQTQAMIQWLKEKLPQYKDIVLLDLHTGLGHRGRLHLLTSGEASKCVNEDLFNELLSPEEDREIYEFTSADADGFYETYGAFNDIFPELANHDQRVCALTLEYGTLGHGPEEQIESMNRWLLEHQGLHNGYASRQLEDEITRDYLDKFFPREDDWRTTVMATSREFFKRVFQRLAKD